MAHRRFPPRRNDHRPRAAALGYNPDVDRAPRLLAAGEGRVAEEIIALAQAENIPIREDPVLASALATVEINQEIPPELYQVVAEILAYIYRVQQKVNSRG